MEELNDVEFLKKLAKKSSYLAQEHITPSPMWRDAYKKLGDGASLLWRLLEQFGSGDSGKTVLK